MIDAGLYDKKNLDNITLLIFAFVEMGWPLFNDFGFMPVNEQTV